MQTQKYAGVVAGLFNNDTLVWAGEMMSLIFITTYVVDRLCMHKLRRAVLGFLGVVFILRYAALVLSNKWESEEQRRRYKQAEVKTVTFMDSRAVLSLVTALMFGLLYKFAMASPSGSGAAQAHPVQSDTGSRKITMD